VIFHKEGEEGVNVTPDHNTPVGFELNDTDQGIFTYRFSGVKLPQVCRIASIFAKICSFLQFHVTWFTQSMKGIRDRFFL